jgi:hypothetical protein
VRKSRLFVMLSMALLLVGVFAVGAFAAEKVFTIAYNEEPQTSDGQMTTSCYMIPMNVYDRLIECITTAPGQVCTCPGPGH